MTVTAHPRVEEDVNGVVLEALEPEGLRPLILKISYWWNMPGMSHFTLH